LPGGFAKRREAPHITATREVAEETQIQLTITRDHRLADYRQDWAHHLENLFVVQVPDNTRIRSRSFEVNGHRWVDVDDEANLPLLTAETVVALDVVKRELPRLRGLR
jgi:ADP-ribose pyrophosphatase YjhB (NUDIX family)